jgi:hypothetical protein
MDPDVWVLFAVDRQGRGDVYVGAVKVLELLLPVGVLEFEKQGP